MSEPVTTTRACFQPWGVLNIGADGRVYPCCVVDDALVVGDLATMSLNEIIAGDRMVGLKRRLIDGRIAGTPCADCCNASLTATVQFKHELWERYLKPAPAAVSVPAMAAPPADSNGSVPNPPLGDDNLGARYTALAAEHQALSARLTSILESRSWRITAGLRWGMGRINDVRSLLRGRGA